MVAILKHKHEQCPQPNKCTGYNTRQKIFHFIINMRTEVVVFVSYLTKNDTYMCANSRCFSMAVIGNTSTFFCSCCTAMCLGLLT